MLTASKKKRENIAEYLLYMWQIEDLIRAYNLDIDIIDKEIVSKYTTVTEEQRSRIHEWYESLIDMMRSECVQKKGHLQLNKNIISSLEDLHKQLMSDPEFSAYHNKYYKILPYIVELRAKAGENKPSELEALFNMMYGILLLRLQGKEISAQTSTAIKDVAEYLAMLSEFYKKDFNNELFKEN